MNIIAVDDERLPLQALEREINIALSDNQVSCFQIAGDALDYAQKHKVDLAFLDIRLGAMNGPELARNLKEINPDVKTIFVTGYSEYLSKDDGRYKKAYLTKPVSAKHIRSVYEELNVPGEINRKGVFVGCFGRFDVFVDGKKVEFSNEVSKEILAYLIYMKGEWISKKMLSEFLNTREKDSAGSITLRQALLELNTSLKAAGIQKVIIKKLRRISVDVSKFKCDYYDYFNDDLNVINTYNGEFMAGYKWAKMLK